MFEAIKTLRMLHNRIWNMSLILDVTEKDLYLNFLTLVNKSTES